jgi:hypothetical protein
MPAIDCMSLAARRDKKLPKNSLFIYGFDFCSRCAAPNADIPRGRGVKACVPILLGSWRSESDGEHYDCVGGPGVLARWTSTVIEITEASERSRTGVMQCVYVVLSMPFSDFGRGFTLGRSSVCFW